MLESLFGVIVPEFMTSVIPGASVFLLLSGELRDAWRSQRGVEGEVFAVLSTTLALCDMDLETGPQSLELKYEN